MSLELAFGIAKSGLLSTQRQLAQVSQNIANADTPGFTRKELPARAFADDRGGPLGVRLGEARRDVDDALLAERAARAADASAAGAREQLLARIEAVHGKPEDGDSLGDVVARLRETFVGLRGSPADPGLQQAAVGAARDVARRFNEVGAAVAEARQAAQDGLGEEVRRANAALADIAELTLRVRGETAMGRSTAETEDQRDLALARLSESLPVRALRQADGGLVLIARNGVALPTDPKALPAFSVQGAVLGPTAYFGPPPGAGTLPGVMLGGLDVTGQLRGGRLAEFVALRDETLPRFQAELDLAAATLSRRLELQGLRLFTDPSGTVPDPALGYVAGNLAGYANTMRVADAVLAEPRLVRDGTHAEPGPPGFVPNPAGGPGGFATLLERTLQFGFGARDAAGTDWPAIQTAGLGPGGQLSSTFVAPRGIEAYTGAMLGAHTRERAEAAELGARAASLKQGLDARFARQSGVDPDAEMAALVRLQNAYAANARVMNTAQQMFDQLFAIAR